MNDTEKLEMLKNKQIAMTAQVALFSHMVDRLFAESNRLRAKAGDICESMEFSDQDWQKVTDLADKLVTQEYGE